MTTGLQTKLSPQNKYRVYCLSRSSFSWTISLHIEHDSLCAKSCVLGAESQKWCKSWPATDGLHYPAIRVMNTGTDLYHSPLPGEMQSSETWLGLWRDTEFYSWLEKLWRLLSYLQFTIYNRLKNEFPISRLDQQGGKARKFLDWKAKGG